MKNSINRLGNITIVGLKAIIVAEQAAFVPHRPRHHPSAWLA